MKFAIFSIFLLLSLSSISLAQEISSSTSAKPQGENEFEETLKDESELKPHLPSVPKETKSPENGLHSQAEDSMVNAGSIKVVLKGTGAVASQLSEGIKYRIKVDWDMTFSQFIRRSGTAGAQILPNQF